MTTRPDVSVVIPTYNRRTMVEEAIESCFQGNDGIDVEVVVVDDGSSDGTRDYLASVDCEQVRPIFQEHQGAQVARNRGQREARGRTIKHLDDDDYLVAGALEQEVRALSAAEADLCYGDYEVVNEINEREEYIPQPAHEDFFVALLSKSVNRLPLTILYTADALTGLWWDESLSFLQDVNFAVRAASRGLRSTHLGEAVAVHRIHSGDRITDIRRRADVAQRLDMKCHWFYDAFLTLRDSQGIAPKQREAVATGLWREAHKLAPFNWSQFRFWYRRICEIHPRFEPPRDHPILSVLDRIFSPGIVERAINPWRKYVRSNG